MSFNWYLWNKPSIAKNIIDRWRHVTYHLDSSPFLYLHHRHCKSQDIVFIGLLYPSPPGLLLKIKMSSLQTLLPWPSWSFTFSSWTSTTLTAALSPPAILEIRPELLLILVGTPLWFGEALVNKLVSYCTWLLSSALEVFYDYDYNIAKKMYSIDGVTSPASSFKTPVIYYAQLRTSFFKNHLDLLEKNNHI